MAINLKQGLFVVSVALTMATALPVVADPVESEIVQPELPLEPAKPDGHGTPAAEPEKKENTVAVNNDATKEKLMFEAFSEDFGKFFACQAKDSDWYSKWFFEKLKFTIAKNPEIRSITLKPEEIAEMMKKQLKTSNATSDKYLASVAEFSVEISKQLVEARSKNPAPKWDDRLGGGRGLLSTLGHSESLKKWTSLFTKAMPASSLRTRLCKTPLKAGAREKADKVSLVKAGYLLSDKKPVEPTTLAKVEAKKQAPLAEPEVRKAIPLSAEEKAALRAARVPVAKTGAAPAVVTRAVAASEAPVKAVVATSKATAPSVSKVFLKKRISNMVEELNRAENKNNVKVADELRLQLKKLREDLILAQ
ncbi:MAG: hypothetical protein ABIR96_13155 [Bdellovibrionota bacterium]